jgi:hypothetical protein
MVTGTHLKPIAVIAAIVVMLSALLYVGLNRRHEAPPSAPMHDTR